jgi:glyoxylase-like metal-dependent hydrolase (beta-lactamase superfamily II)
MRVSDHVHALRIPFQITTEFGTLDRFVFAFIVCGPEIYLIDTGVASSQELIFEYIRQIGRKPEEISTIILTHSHPDHIGSAKNIKEITGCKVMAHQGEKDWIEDVDKQFAERPVPGFYSLVGGSVTVDRTLEQGEIISLGDNLKVKVVHTPGHSQGSISLYLEPDHVLFTGDLIPVSGDMPIYDDPLVLIESVKKLKAFDDVSILLSSWDEPRTGALVAKVMDDGIDYINCLHNAVIEVAKTNPSIEVVDLCKSVLRRLDLPLFMANPLVARSLASSLQYNVNKGF